MGFFSWIILGLLAGALAKWLMPGKDDGGWFMTMILGIIGAFVGGFLGSLLGLTVKVDGINFPSLLTATAGAFVVLFIYNRLKADS